MNEQSLPYDEENKIEPNNDVDEAETSEVCDSINTCKMSEESLTNDEENKTGHGEVIKVETSEETSNKKPSYAFRENGRLLDEEGNAFKFTNQKDYEKLCLDVTESIYRMLTEPPYSLRKVPLRASEDTDALLDKEIQQEESFIFVSENFSHAEKLIIIIHGSGAVRAGQWSRRLIINESLEVGSQLPYVRRCLEKGWAVLITNTNDNYYKDEEGKKQSKGFSKDPIEHGRFVWANFVEKSKAECIAIVAHSFGGMVTTRILKSLDDEQLQRIRAICLTDAIFDSAVLVDERRRGIFAINWVTSDLELDQQIEWPLRTPKPRNYLVVSAGTEEHERTSANAINPIFTWIESRFENDLY